jgi:hypothetical protein
MTESTDLTTTESAELEAIEAQERELAQQSKASLSSFASVTPRLDVRQGTSKNAPDEAQLGDFFNAVTGVVYGKKIEFLVAVAHKGRFLSDKRSPDGRSYGAGDVAIVPDHWPEQYRGKVFADLPEAQETYSRLANEGTIEWDRGPAIVDTFNFIGFVTAAEGRELEPFAVLLSIKATNKQARASAAKAGTLLRGQPNLWTKALQFESLREVNKSGEPYYVASVVGYGAEPTVQQRKGAVEAYLVSQQIGFVDPETVPRETPGEGGVGDTPAEDAVVPGKGAGF